MGPSLHLLFCAFEKATLASQLLVSKGHNPSFVACACKTASLGPELQVSMGRRPHLCFYCIQNSDFSNRIASLYVSKTSSVVLRFHIRDIMTRINSLSMGPSPHLWFCAFTAAILYQN